MKALGERVYHVPGSFIGPDGVQIRRVLSENGVTYWFGKTEDGWRIVSLTGSPPDRIVTCND